MHAWRLLITASAYIYHKLRTEKPTVRTDILDPPPISYMKLHSSFLGNRFLIEALYYWKFEITWDIYIYIWHFSRENYSVDTWRVENIIGFPCVSGCHWYPLLLSWPSCMHTFWIQQQDKLFKVIEQNPFEFGKLFLVHQKERGTKVLKILELMWN